jgi:hypothetical protein
MMSHDLDVASRLERLEQLLDQCRIPSAADAGRGPDAEAAVIRLEGLLNRIQRLAREVQSGLAHRHDADALDGVTIRLLLDDYAAAVQQLRASTIDAGRRLAMVAHVIGDGRRFIREERKRRQ